MTDERSGLVLTSAVCDAFVDSTHRGRGVDSWLEPDLRPRGRHADLP
jgi:hypothetical protein